MACMSQVSEQNSFKVFLIVFFMSTKRKLKKYWNLNFGSLFETLKVKNYCHSFLEQLLFHGHEISAAHSSERTLFWSKNDERNTLGKCFFCPVVSSHDQYKANSMHVDISSRQKENCNRTVIKVNLVLPLNTICCYWRILRQFNKKAEHPKHEVHKFSFQKGID